MPADPGKPWKITLSLLFIAFLAGMAATFTLAVRRYTGVADPDYYKHGRQYGRTASGARNPGLDMKISASLQGSLLKVEVRDGSGAPVGGGKLAFVAGRAAEGAASSLLPLAETAPGTFEGPCPLPRQGEIRGTLHFTCGEASASRKLVLFN